MANTMRHLALAALASLALSGCQTITSLDAADGDAVAAASSAPAGRRAGRGTAGDVEAPDLFATTDQGLWDGRPSLGGVWVASPEATDPERVMIRNPANDRSVVGALFRRERENPGPRLQVSSDAAAALGMLAGAPAELSVVALRRVEAAPEAPPAAQSAAPPAGSTEVAGTRSTPAQAAASGPSPATLPTAAAASATAAAAAPETPRPFWRRRGARAPDAADAATAPAPGTASAPAAAAAPPPAPAPVTTAPAAAMRIQIGIFSVEANARQAATGLGAAGVPTEVRREDSNGNAFWRVLAVPPTAADREPLMSKVKGLGFKDAYFVTR